jgi:SnoaL-like domain
MPADVFDKEFDMTIDEVIAHAEIRQVLATYFRALDREDLDLLKSTFHPDATDDHGRGIFQGNAHEMCVWILERAKRFDMVRQHHLTGVYIEMDGEKFANVESYGIVLRSERDPTTAQELRQVAGARVLDRFERRDGKWKILDRQIVIDCAWSGLPKESLDVLEPFAKYGSYPDDASYKFFDKWRRSGR